MVGRLAHAENDMRIQHCVISSWVIQLCAFCAHANEPSLAARLDPLIGAHQGKVSVVVQEFGQPVGYTINPDEPMPTASLIKFPVMVEAYFQFQEGKAKPGDLCLYERDDKVKGSGILVEHFTPGMTFCLRDAIRMMIVWSDNMATNIVLDHIGLAATA